MADRPYTLLSCGMSLDGYLDNPGTTRLTLSNDDDFDRVDSVRSGCDAIMVGAATIRNDNPRLLVRAAHRRADRVVRGCSPTPVKVTVTATGDLDPAAQFFTAGDADKLVYCPEDSAATVRRRLGAVATVVELTPPLQMCQIGADLTARGIGRLMVEGGGRLHTQFLTADLADELQLVVAPLFVGDSRAPRFVLDGKFPWNAGRRAELADVRRIGDVVLLRYALSARYDAERLPG